MSAISSQVCPHLYSAISEAQFHTELDDSHRRAYAADLSHAWPVGRQRVIADEADRIGRAEVGGIGSVEELRPELERHALANREVLEQREVNVLLPGCLDD